MGSLRVSVFYVPPPTYCILHHETLVASRISGLASSTMKLKVVVNERKTPEFAAMTSSTMKIKVAALLKRKYSVWIGWLWTSSELAHFLTWPQPP